MNKLSIFTLALILLGACVKETSDESARLWTGNSFVASIQKNAVAKSSLTAGVNAWNAGDEVAVYADGGAAVSFTAAASGESVQFNSAGPLYGSSFALVYPYAAADGVSGGLVNAVIPQRQKAVSGSYDPSATLSVTAADDLSGPDSDYSKGLIRTIAGKSWPIEAAGNPATDLVKDAAGTDAVFIYPEGMASSPDGNTIYMVDGTVVNCRIRKITYTQN